MTVNKSKLLHELWSNHDSEAIAFVDDKRYSYGELTQKVAQYSTWLSNKGIKKGDRVGIFMPNCIDFLFIYFGVTRLGAVIIPVNSFLLDVEVDYIVKDSDMKMLISATEVQVSCPTYNIKDLRVETATITDTVSATKCDKNDIATIIYTSGTTGNPKGAMLTHANIVEDGLSTMQVIPILRTNRLLSVLPMYHSFGFLCGIILNLLSGATSYLQKGFNATDTRKLIREEEITTIFMIPTMFQLLARINAKDDLKSVTIAVSGGASLPKAVAESFEATYHFPILEGYGLSEASPVVCINHIDLHKHYSVGPAAPGIEVKIVDDQGKVLKAGEIGELIVKGPNVMVGYLNLPEETAKTLQDGWLHTGDMAYKDEDGFVYIVDRVKDMINLNGENVYPREIENKIYLHPDVAEVAVVGKHDSLRGETVWAYIVMKEGKKLSTVEMRKFLKDKVAPFKMPRGFVQKDSLPKNSTGKIMKRLLS